MTDSLAMLKYKKYAKKCEEHAEERYLRHEHDCFMKWRRHPGMFSERLASHQTYKFTNPLGWTQVKQSD